MVEGVGEVDGEGEVRLLYILSRFLDSPGEDVGLYIGYSEGFVLLILQGAVRWISEYEYAL